MKGRGTLRISYTELDEETVEVGLDLGSLLIRVLGNTYETKTANTQKKVVKVPHTHTHTKKTTD